MYHTLVGPNECLVSFSFSDGIPVHADVINMTTGHICITHKFNHVETHVKLRRAKVFWNYLLTRGYTRSSH